MKCLFIADRPQDLRPAGDSTLYMIREAMRRGWEAYHTTPRKVFWSGTELFAEACRVNACAKHALPELGAESRLSFEGGVDAVFIRKDPPFDLDYISLCWLLTTYEGRVRMVNSPALLLRFHEKMPPLAALAEGCLRPEDVLPTCISPELDRIVEFVKGLACDRIIIKPWLGYGGHDIQRLDRASFLNAPRVGEGRWMVQPYFEEVERTGDRRGFFFGGKWYGSVGRMPKKGGYVSNLAQGGSAVDLDLSNRERGLIVRIEKWLERTHIDFAGSDFIDGRLSEFNVTSPTGFASYEGLYGEDPAVKMFDAVFGP